MRTLLDILVVIAIIVTGYFMVCIAAIADQMFNI
jgi:hypothetical protein